MLVTVPVAALMRPVFTSFQLVLRPKPAQNPPRKPGPGTGSIIEQPRVVAASVIVCVVVVIDVSDFVEAVVVVVFLLLIVLVVPVGIILAAVYGGGITFYGKGVDT